MTYCQFSISLTLCVRLERGCSAIKSKFDNTIHVESWSRPAQSYAKLAAAVLVYRRYLTASIAAAHCTRDHATSVLSRWGLGGDSAEMSAQRLKPTDADLRRISTESRAVKMS